jgi:hypothetical protein
VFISQYLNEADSSLPHPFSIKYLLLVMDVRVQDGPTVVPQGIGHSVNFG